MTTDQSIARRQDGGAIATEAPSANPWASAGLLKPYAGGAVHEAPRVDALATISAGFKGENGFPVVSRDGTIHVRNAERAPGLVAELKRRGGKSLTIALVHNDPKDVLQQWFATYSKTRLEMRGDQHEIVIIHLKDTGQRDRKGNPVQVAERETVRRDQNPERYRLLAQDMKVQTSLYFVLAEWDGDQPRLIFPDGLGQYRLAFTSLNSAEAIKSQLSYVASLTGGRVAGVPLELSIAYRNLAGPDGVRREKVPIWSLVLKPPQTIKLSPAIVASILQSGIAQAEQLAIAPPARESLEYAEYEGADADLDEARIVDGEVVSRQRNAWDTPLANPDHARKEYFGAVGETTLRDKEARDLLVQAFTHGRYTRLSTFIHGTTAREWSAFLEVAAERTRLEVESWQQEGAPPRPQQTDPTAKPARSYDDLFENDPDLPTPPTPAARAPMTRETMPPEVAAAAQLTGAPPAPPELPRPEGGRTYTRAQWAAMYAAWARRRQFLDSARVPEDIEALKGAALVQATHQAIAEVDELESYLAAEPVEDEADSVLVDAF